MEWNEVAIAVTGKRTVVLSFVFRRSGVALGVREM